MLTALRPLGEVSKADLTRQVNLTQNAAGPIVLAVPYNLGRWRRALDRPESVCATWEGVDAAGELQAAIDIPVLHENDGNAVAVGASAAAMGAAILPLHSSFGPDWGGVGVPSPRPSPRNGGSRSDG